MAHRLMSLWNVPDDELADIHELLEAHAIDYYETRGSAFGLSGPALWLRDHEQLTQVKALLEQYAQQRAVESRQRWQQEVAEGKARTMLDMLREQPVLFVVCVVMIVGLLYVSLVSVWSITGVK